MVIWIGFLGARVSRANALCLAFAAFTPGFIYDHTVFPMALAGFALLLVLLFLERERWIAAGLAGAVLAATYPSGVLVAPAVAVWLLINRGDSAWRTTAARIGQTSGLTALGALFVLVLQRLETGAWDAYFKVQAHYHRDLVAPFVTLFRSTRPIFSHAPNLRSMPHLEALFAAVLVLAVLAHVAVVRRPFRPFDQLLGIVLVTYWLVPLCLRRLDIYRDDALLIPAALLLRRVSTAFQVAALACGVALSVPMAEAFLTRVLG
jgi:hypothetical protein